MLYNIFYTIVYYYKLNANKNIINMFVINLLTSYNNV